MVAGWGIAGHGYDGPVAVVGVCARLRGGFVGDDDAGFVEVRAQRVEDLYKPYRKKRATRASKARDAGLEPLALLILAQDRSAKDPLAVASGLVNPEAGYPTPEDALQGAQDIVAEVVADDAEAPTL